MKPRFSLLLLFLYCFCFGQEKKKDSLLLEFYSKKSHVFLNKNWDSLHYYSRKGLELATQLSNYNRIIDFSTDLAIYHKEKGNFKRGKEIIYNAIKINQDNQLDSIRLGNMYTSFGNLFFYSSNKDSAIINYKRALLYYRNDSLKLTTTLLRVGHSLRSKDTEESMRIFFRLLPFFKKNKMYGDLSNAQMGISNNFLQSGLYEKARKHLFLALKNDLKTVNKRQLAGIYLNLGNVYGSMDKIDSSLFYFKKAKKNFIKKDFKAGLNHTNVSMLQLYKNIGDYDNAMRIINELEKNNIEEQLSLYSMILSMKSDILFRKGDEDRAIDLTKKAIDVAEKSKDMLSMRKAYFAGIKNYLKFSNKTMVPILREYDSVMLASFDSKKVKAINDLEIKYQTQQKENKILKLANENEKQKVAMERTRLLLFSIIGAILLAGVIGYFIRQKRQQQQQLQLLEKTIEASDNEKNRIGRELHDGVASKILQLVHNAENLNEEYTHKLQDVYSEIRGLSHQLNQTPMHSEEPIFERLLEIRDGIQQKVNLEITPISLIVKEPTATHIYRIVQELVANTIKHAKASNITIIVSQPDNNLILNYTDDGKGFTNEIKGKGLQNIEHRVNLLKGNITYKTKPNNGFSTKITIPV